MKTRQSPELKPSERFFGVEVDVCEPSAVERCIDLIENHDGLRVPGTRLQADLVAAIPSDDYRATLATVDVLPSLPVNCAKPSCGRRLGRWKLNASVGVVEPDYRPSRPEDRGGPKPYTARVAAGKGNIVGGPTTHDGLGTFAYVCQRCHRPIKVGAKYRTVLYLAALRDKTPIIKI